MLRTALVTGLLATVLLPAEDVVRTDEQGRLVAIPLPMDEAFKNPWPASYEDAMRSRADGLIRSGKVGVNTALENEKGTYPPTMLAFLKGERDAAIQALQSPDVEAGQHAETLGIDYYWCFTLKGQMRKYFYFGRFLEEGYRQRMFDGAKAWTASDPRPNTELVLLLDSPDEQVRTYALQTLEQMWRSGPELLAMAEQAEGEGHQNKKDFAAYLRSIAAEVGEEKPSDAAGWWAWWEKITRGDWKVYEEYDRRVNLRPHPQFGIGNGPVGTDWSPGTRGGVVDWRNTDNLRGMREVAVYLMAEETGNELTRKVFKDRIRRTATGFMGVGMGEWDSESYHSHTIAAYLNLYDFAKDDEVRLMAKAILDYLTTAGAVKAWRGGTCGPIKRDYGNTAMWSSHASTMDFWIGSAPIYDDRPHNDLIHAITSNYRPPAAVVAFGRREFERPCEIWSSHPDYSNWLPGRGEDPMYHETTYFGRSFQMGSKADGPGYDEAGMKILVQSGQGVDFVVPTSQKKGNPCTGGGVQIAQSGRLAIWQCKKGDAPVNVLLPESATVEVVDGVAFVAFAGGATFAAFRPIRATFSGLDPKGLSAYGDKRDKDKRAGLSLLAGSGDGSGPCGWALEMGELPDHADYAAFKASILAKNTVEARPDGALLTGSDGRSLAITVTSGRQPQVDRDGVAHDWAAHRALYQGAAGGPSPVHLGWKEGVLTVEAGGHRFQGTLDLATGAYRFENTLAE